MADVKCKHKNVCPGNHGSSFDFPQNFLNTTLWEPRQAVTKPVVRAPIVGMVSHATHKKEVPVQSHNFSLPEPFSPPQSRVV